MKTEKIKVFYTPKQVNTNKNIVGTTSRSPLKPLLLMRALDGHGFGKHLDVESNFEPFTNEDFEIAHTKEYVKDFFNRGALCMSNGLPWSPELADSVRYTNASLYNAVRHAYLNPEQVTFSPTSGFHHARPTGGSGFCTFSGQVIASVKMFREFGISGAYLDLDGHFGNSIEDSRYYVKDLDLAIPKGFNFGQLQGRYKEYHQSLINALSRIEEAVLAGRIHYVVWAHGADSHDKDDLGGQVDTFYWTKCSETFYAWVKSIDAKLAEQGRPGLPVILSLFGGYRRDSYYSVLSLHIKDITVALNTLCGTKIKYEAINEDKTGWGNDERWLEVDGEVLPLSMLRALEPKKYMTDHEFRNTELSKNEKAVLDYLSKNPDVHFTGNQLGLNIKNWKNHSMGKWAKRLVRRGLVVYNRKKGYKRESIRPL